MRSSKEMVAEWQDELAARLRRPAQEILEKGLSAGDFSPAHRVEIRYADDSFAQFKCAFALISEEKGRVAVFTEHCGYLELPLLAEMHVIEVHEEHYYHAGEA